jgi:hypothetical protein
MREPMIGSTAMVRTEIRANRATFNATFAEVDRNAAEVTRKAAARVHELDTTLRAFGGERTARHDRVVYALQ